MPRRGQYTRDFPAVEMPAGVAGRVGIRVAPSIDHRGVARVSELDPAQYRCARLAGELADEWVDLYAMGRASTAVVSGYRKAIWLFCASVDDQLRDAGAAASLSGAGPNLARVFAEWERVLPSGYRAGSMTPGTVSGYVRALITRRAQHEDRPVDAALLRLIDSGTAVEWGGTDEIDEFTRADKRALVRAGWTWVNALDERLATGWAMARTGRDPARHGWTSLENLLWAVAGGKVTFLDISANLPHHTQWPEALRQLVASPDGSVSGPAAVTRLPRRLIAQLYPADLDLQAYRVLLAAASGRTPEEVSRLREDDVEFLPSGVRLRMTKKRAQAVRSRRFLSAPGAPRPGDELAPEPEIIFPDQPHREVAEIVRRLIAVTEQVRELAQDPERPLFMTAAVTNTLEVRFGRWDPGRPAARFKAWIEAAGLEIAGAPDIRRMRKSTKVEKAIASAGSIAAAADDHHEQTFRGHYAQGTTLRVVSGRVITTAQEHWLQQALNGPTLITDTGSEALADAEQAEALGLSGQQAEDIISGALDMGVADCKDPNNSPYGKPGELCPVAPLRCFECRHAFLLPNHLPQHLLFMDHLERLRLRLAPKHFDARWGRSRANLEATIAARTDQEISLARTHIDAGEATLHLPFYAHAEFDA